MSGQSAIFAPVFTVILLTMIVWCVMYFRRITYILRNKINPQIVGRTGYEANAPAPVNNASDNLKNLFEIPTVFYALTIILFINNAVSPTIITLAGGFAALRILHSLIHCTYNRVIHRFAVYVASTLCLWAMVLLGIWTIIG